MGCDAVESGHFWGGTERVIRGSIDRVSPSQTSEERDYMRKLMVGDPVWRELEGTGGTETRGGEMFSWLIVIFSLNYFFLSLNPSKLKTESIFLFKL